MLNTATEVAIAMLSYDHAKYLLEEFGDREIVEELFTAPLEGLNDSQWADLDIIELEIHISMVLFELFESEGL